MYKRIVVLVLLVAFAMQSFQKSLIILDYYANTSIFAQNCVNKDRPELKCKGKCQMLKKLQAEEKKARQQPEQKGENKIELQYPLQTASLYTPQFSAVTSIYQTLAVTPPTDLSLAIFHPPALF